MALLKIGGLLALLMAPCAALYAKAQRGFVRTMPFSLCAQGLFLYGWSLFLPFSWGVGALGLCAVGCWGYYGVSLLRDRRMLAFFSLPCVLFVLAAPLWYYACCNRLYLSYDEYSHWGLIVKLIHAFDGLPRAGAGAELLLFNYPPAIAMVEALACQFFGYREGIVYFGHVLLVFGLLLGLVPEKASAPKQGLAALFLLLVLLLLFPFALLRLFSEPIIALLFALLIYYGMEGEQTRAEFVCTAVICAFFALSKNSAPLFVAMALGVRLAMHPRKQEALRCGKLALTGAAAFFSYLIYCGIMGIQPAFASYFGQNLRLLLSGQLPEQYASVPVRFAQYVLTKPFAQAGVYSTYATGTSAGVWFLIFVVVGAFLIAIARDRRQAVRLCVGLCIANAVYVLFLLFSYVFFFNPSEALRLNELDRYLSLALLMTGLLLAAYLAKEACEAPSRVRLAAVVGCTLLCLPFCHPKLMYDTLITRETVKNTLWAREETERTSAFLRETLAKEEMPWKIRILGNLDHMALRYEMIFDADFGHPHSNWGEATFAGDAALTREEIMQGDYRYVYIADTVPDDDHLAVDARYAALFENGAEDIRANALYVVTQSTQGITLRFLAGRP